MLSRFGDRAWWIVLVCWWGRCWDAPLSPRSRTCGAAWKAKVKKDKDKDKIRITLDLTPELYDRLERLETAEQAGSKATLIRDALRVYEFIVNKSIEGCDFRIKRGKEETLVFVGAPQAD